jgi:hypothetical protein
MELNMTMMMMMMTRRLVHEPRVGIDEYVADFESDPINSFDLMTMTLLMMMMVVVVGLEVEVEVGVVMMLEQCSPLMELLVVQQHQMVEVVVIVVEGPPSCS